MLTSNAVDFWKHILCFTDPLNDDLFLFQKYYLVGSNNTQTRFRVLKIDRTEPKDLEIYDDKVEYSAEEIRDLVTMIESGNRKAGASGISRFISAFGIVGKLIYLDNFSFRFFYPIFFIFRFYTIFRGLLYHINNQKKKSGSY